MIHEEAKWVRPDEDCEAPIMLGKIFVEGGVKSAKISICGLGCLLYTSDAADD